MSEEIVYASADDLFDVQLAEEDFEVRPGKWVHIRALTRDEMMRGGKLDDNRPKQEQFLLSRAVLNPVLTEADVARWQKAANFMEVEMVARRINTLSGVGKDAAKSGVHDDGDEPGA